MRKRSVLLLSVVALLIAFAAGAWWYQGMQAEKSGTLARESSSTLEPDHAIRIGPQSARVVIVEFFDPACETCAVFYRHIKDLMSIKGDKVRLVLRYAPFHEGAPEVVKMLEAARKQGKFWETLEVLFASQEHWTSHHVAKPELIWPLLKRVGLDVERLRADMNNPALDALIKQDLADAAKLGIRRTPGFLVNGKPLPSFGIQQLWKLVEAEIEENH